uniref:hypothetical protein n=1 Tax=Methylobacterium sp. B34 TaxID=95563 RepID=UPI000FE13CBD|nr:hypothetical protein [Methylobacterium sp. B34]
MTSERAARANRRNAQASSGPRTAAGKARSGQNARKHGLSAAGPNPEVEAEIETLAVLIAGEQVRDAAVLEAARAIAEAHYQIQRVKAYKIALLRSGKLAQQQEAGPSGCSLSEIPMVLFQQFEGLERYERRALSRRKFAVRRFMSSLILP